MDGTFGGGAPSTSKGRTATRRAAAAAAAARARARTKNDHLFRTAAFISATVALVQIGVVERHIILPQYHAARLVLLENELKCGAQNVTLPRTRTRAMVESAQGAEHEARGWSAWHNVAVGAAGVGGVIHDDGLVPLAVPIVLPEYLQRNLDADFAPYESWSAAPLRGPAPTASSSRSDASNVTHDNNRHEHYNQQKQQQQQQQHGPIHPFTFTSTPSTLRRHYSRLTQGMHVAIRSNAVQLIASVGTSFESRNANTLAMLRDVSSLYEIPDVDLLISTGDRPRPPPGVKNKHGLGDDGVPILVMAKRRRETYVTYPDHTFYGWTEARTCGWDVERHRIRVARVGGRTMGGSDDGPDGNGTWIRKEASARTGTTKNVAFFRGNPDTDPIRQALLRASPNHPELDVQAVRVGKMGVVGNRGGDGAGGGSSGSAGGFVSLAQHCRYKYLLHVPGVSYAARLKYLLHAGGVVIWVHRRPQRQRQQQRQGRKSAGPTANDGSSSVDDDNDYREFWYDYLHDGNNCIVVQASSDGSDAAEGVLAAVRRLEDNATLYDMIAASNTRWRDEFDYATVLSYWAALLRRYHAACQS